MLRAGSFFPEGLIERYPGVDRAVAAAVSEMVTNGVSASKVKRGAVHGHRPHERQPGVEDVLLARRHGRRPAGT